MPSNAKTSSVPRETKLYNVYRQNYPLQKKGLWHADVELIGQVEAASNWQALRKAHGMAAALMVGSA